LGGRFDPHQPPPGPLPCLHHFVGLRLLLLSDDSDKSIVECGRFVKDSSCNLQDQDSCHVDVVNHAPLTAFVGNASTGVMNIDERIQPAGERQED